MKTNEPPRFQPREHYGMTAVEILLGLVALALLTALLCTGVWYLHTVFDAKPRPPTVEASWPTLVGEEK